MSWTLAAALSGVLFAGGAEPALPDTAEVAAVQTRVEAVAILADLRDFETLESLFAETVRVDYTSLVGGEPGLRSAHGLAADWAQLLPGFDRTRHALDQITVTIEGEEARAGASVTADHWIGEDQWRVTGRYDYRLQRQDGDWEITDITFVLEDETGSRDLLERAAGRAVDNPVPAVQRARTEATVLRFLTALEDKDMDAFASVWAEDAVQEMPYAPDGFPGRVEGRDALIAHYAAWPENSGAADFTSELVFHSGLDPQTVFVEWRGDVEIVPTGRRYLQHYGGLFVVEDGRITLFREYFNPDPFRYAFGLDEGGAFN